MNRLIIFRVTAALAIFFGASSLPAQAQYLDIWCVWDENAATGTCVLLRGPSGFTAILDETGHESQAVSLYKDIIEPEGIHQIGYAVAGHYDSDHIGGLDVLVDLMGGTSSFGVFYDRGGTVRADGDPIQADYLELVQNSGRRATPLLDGQSDLDLGYGAIGRFLSMGAPDTAGTIYLRGRPPINGNISENNKSLSLLVTYGGFDFYFGSDLEGEGEQAIDDVVVDDLGRDVDVLLVDHHGADTGNISSLDFLQKMKPEVAVISVGRNGFGHPRRTTVERLQQVVEPLPQRIIRLAPGDTDDPATAPEGMDYCHTVDRHLHISTDGTKYTVDTVERTGGSDITEPGLTDHRADQGSHIPTPTPAPTPWPWEFKVEINQSVFRGGDTLRVDVWFREAVVDWDGYLVFSTDYGLYSVSGDRLVPGVTPMVVNMMEHHSQWTKTVFSTSLPPGRSGECNVYAAILPTGTKPTWENARGPFAQLASTQFRLE